jgi:hypothetical protein
MQPMYIFKTDCSVAHAACFFVITKPHATVLCVPILLSLQGSQIKFEYIKTQNMRKVSLPVPGQYNNKQMKHYIADSYTE